METQWKNPIMKSDFSFSLLKEREKSYFHGLVPVYNPFALTPTEFSRKMAKAWEKFSTGTFGQCEECGCWIQTSIIVNLPEEQICPACRNGILPNGRVGIYVLETPAH